MDAVSVAGPVTTLPETGRQWPRQGEWTYEDFLALPDDPEDFNRYEVIEGVLYVAPPPSVPHQRRLGNLYRRVGNFVEQGRLGEVFLAPIGLLLPGGAAVQPDVFFVAASNSAVVGHQEIRGAPDLVVEVAAPSTAAYDRRQKQDAYARAGVPEYWIVDPLFLEIEVLRLEEGGYRSLGVFRDAQVLPTQALAGLPHTVAELLD